MFVFACVCVCEHFIFDFLTQIYELISFSFILSLSLFLWRAQVPSVYFQPGFRITDLDFFRTLADPAAMVLSEKLSHYLDLVEVSLLKQISCRSEAFFNALCTIQV